MVRAPFFGLKSQIFGLFGGSLWGPFKFLVIFWPNFVPKFGQILAKFSKFGQFWPILAKNPDSPAFEFLTAGESGFLAILGQIWAILAHFGKKGPCSAPFPIWCFFQIWNGTERRPFWQIGPNLGQIWPILAKKAFAPVNSFEFTGESALFGLRPKKAFAQAFSQKPKTQPVSLLKNEGDFGFFGQKIHMRLYFFGVLKSLGGFKNTARRVDLIGDTYD